MSPQSGAPCRRCGTPCVVAATRDPDARLMRKAAVPKGLCVNCAMTDWLQHIEPLPTILDRQGPAVLLLEPVQTQVAAVLTSARADVDPTEVDWRAIVDRWHLPFPTP